MIRLTYISTPMVAPDRVDAQLKSIIASALRRNPKLSLTGALVYTSKHFCQVLEGPAKDVDSLVELLQRDPRHRDIVVLERTPITERGFAHWSMRFCYSGNAHFVRSRLDAALHAPRNYAALQNVLKMFEAFCDDAPMLTIYASSSNSEGSPACR
jgi:Sensors of blue-light using FAD